MKSTRPTRRWLMTGLAVAAASTLALTGCSSESDDSGTGVPGLDAALGSGALVASGSSGDDAGPAISSVAKNGDLVTAAVAATSAAGGEVREGTLRLRFDGGSIDDLSAVINCGAISQLINDDAGLVLVYPDGELDCRAER